MKVVEEAPDDVGTAREHLNLLFDIAEPSAQLGRNGGAGSQRTAFRDTGQHRPDERERESGVRQRDNLARGSAKLV